MKAFAIIKTGSTFPAIRQRFGDFDSWMMEGCGLSAAEAPVIDVMAGEDLPAVEDLSGAIMTGSPAMVTDRADWMQALSAWVRQAVQKDLPLLGVCFGHQLLAQAMGGEVDYHPEGREIGTVEIQLTPEGRQDPLLGILPEAFIAHATHAQTVIRLPEKALRLAGNPFEAHHAFRVGDNAWGVQFHPEFTADIMRAYIGEYAAALPQDGNAEALKAAIDHTEAANALLKRFFDYCMERSRNAGFENSQAD
jgi:GMP synthase (glutamine-hydrolysing)